MKALKSPNNPLSANRTRSWSLTGSPIIASSFEVVVESPFLMVWSLRWSKERRAEGNGFQGLSTINRVIVHPSAKGAMAGDRVAVRQQYTSYQ